MNNKISFESFLWRKTLFCDFLLLRNLERKVLWYLKEKTKNTIVMVSKGTTVAFYKGESRQFMEGLCVSAVHGLHRLIVGINDELGCVVKTENFN